MPKTLITGGAGFIGLHLGRALAQRGYEVTLLDSFARAVEDRDLEECRALPGVTLLRANLLTDSLEDVAADYDHVVHLAALLGVQNVRNRPFEVLSLNHAMLEKAIGFARRQKHLSRFVFASTSEVYAGTLFQFGMAIPTPETTPLALSDLAEPRTSYMLSKIYGEALCRYSGLPFTTIRIHNAYGPRMGMSHVIPELLRKAHHLADSAELEVFSADHRRTFCYVRDVCEFIARILETPACAGETMNIGTQEPDISMKDLGAVVLRTVGRDAGIVALPASPGSPERRAPDMTHTNRLTGYRSQVDLATGVGLTYEWYRANVFSGARVTAV